MCRNIRVLSNFQPPTTAEEIRAASLQYVRKVTGLQKPGHHDEEAFELAIHEIAEATTRVLASVHPKGEPRTREGEREKGRERWKKREAALKAKS